MVSTAKQTISLGSFEAARNVIGFNSRFPQNTLGQPNLLAIAALNEARAPVGVAAAPVAEAAAPIPLMGVTPAATIAETPVAPVAEVPAEAAGEIPAGVDAVTAEEFAAQEGR